MRCLTCLVAASAGHGCSVTTRTRGVYSSRTQCMRRARCLHEDKKGVGENCSPRPSCVPLSCVWWATVASAAVPVGERGRARPLGSGPATRSSPSPRSGGSGRAEPRGPPATIPPEMVPTAYGRLRTIPSHSLLDISGQSCVARSVKNPASLYAYVRFSIERETANAEGHPAFSRLKVPTGRLSAATIRPTGGQATTAS